MKTVNFTQMKSGTKDEYLLLDKYEQEYINGTADRILKFMKTLTATLEGYKITRLEHSLHSEYAAAVLKPYVSKKTHWIIEKHGEFQMYYYAHHLGKNKNLRDKYKDHEFYKDAVNFCEKWDQASFDPNFKSMTLEDFAPMVKRIFSRKPYSLL